MKKSQLRNIIRESIKELMTEQKGGKPTINVTCDGNNKNCTAGSCSFNFEITPYSTPNTVLLTAILCGTGTVTFERDGQYIGDSDTCVGQYTTHVAFANNWIESNPASPLYKHTYKFKATFECANGQTVTKVICIGPDMMVKNCNKPIPTSPPLSPKKN